MNADDLSSITESRCVNDYNYGDYSSITRVTETAAPKIYGRDHEKQKLLDTYQRVVQTQESQVVFVHGTSGQGKTSLVDSLREPVCDSGGYFCAGKFFQDSGTQEPYAAITSAFSDLCDLVVQSSDFDVQEQVRIKEGLALDGHLLARSINLQPFFSEEESGVTPDGVNFARFRSACKTFLITMATEKHPVVMFLDDLQWIEEDGSGKLIQMFMNDEHIKNIMFVLSYRDEETTAVEDILQSSRTRDTVDIQLPNLELSSVRLIVASAFESVSPSDIDHLSVLALQRSGGNPFFVHLFMDAIKAEQLIDLSGPCPTFDMDKIRSSIMVSESVADLLSKKICRLSDDVKDVLILASLIGYSFDQQVIFGMPHSSTSHHESLLSCLVHAVDVGFIEAIGGGRYQFTHDRLQTGFLDLVDKSTREHLHLQIGETYLAQKTEGAIYNAAVHLNVTPDFLSGEEQWIKLARINLKASQYCQRLSAFDKAVSLLRHGIDLLDSIGVKWSHGLLELSFELTESLARMALLVGDFETCSKATKEAKLHAKTIEQRTNIMLINVESKMANNQMEESVKAAIRALSELGVKVPRRVSVRHVGFKILKLKFLMARKTDDDILGLPPAEDLSVTVAIRLLVHVTLYALMANEELMAVYAALHAMDLTLQHGLSTYSAPALAIFGIAVLQMGDVERAYSLGKLALKLLERNSSRAADCATLGFATGLLLHWKEPVKALRDSLSLASSDGFENGDLVYATFCISQTQSMGVVAGVHLEVQEKFIQAHYSRVKSLGQEELLIWLTPHLQYLTNMRSCSTYWSHLVLLSGEFMNFNTHLKQMKASSNMIAISTLLLKKAELSNTFGFHRIARETFDEVESLGHAIHLTYGFTMLCWGAGVANFEGFRTDRKRKYLRKARKSKKRLKQRDRLGPNASTFLRHLQLKETFLRQRKWNHGDARSCDDETLGLLDHRLQHFSVNGKTCEPHFVSAAAFVDGGSIAERMGRYDESIRYYERAKEIYAEECGAFAPAAWLEEKCEECHRKQRGYNLHNVRSPLVGGIVQVHVQSREEESP